MRHALSPLIGMTLGCVLAALSSVAAAQTAPPAVATDHVAGPVAWSQLSPDQRRLLAPLHDQWQQLPAARQQRLATHADQWAGLSPEHQQLIRQRLARWAAMTPIQRRELRANARAFRELPPAERARVSAAYRHFQMMSPAERRALRERWAAEHPNSAAPIPMHPPASHGR